MSRQPHTAQFAARSRQVVEFGALSDPETLPSTLTPTQGVGMLAVVHSPLSQQIPFLSGAEGHTATQVHIVGERLDREILGKSLGQVSLKLPAEEGNVLIVRREALIDTSNELARRFEDYRTPFDGTNLTLAIMRRLSFCDLDSVRYGACISYFSNPVTGNEEVVCATASAAKPVFLHLPLLQSALSEAA